MTELFDKETGEILQAPKKAKPIPAIVAAAFARYVQAAAKQEHWVKHRYINGPQVTAVAARLDEAPRGIDDWQEALDNASKSDWLCGRVIGEKGTRFKMHLDFLLMPRAFSKVLHGFYNRDEPKPKPVLPSMQPPHLKPQPAFVPEPLPVRLASMIASYRKHNKWADANRIEEQLAALEKRPAVLVPAPEVAFTSGKAERPRGSAERSGANSHRITDIPPSWLDEEIPSGAYHEVEA